jgi:hypothetical protein
LSTWKWPYSFDAFFELLVDEQRQVFGALVVQVDEVLEIAVDFLLEHFVFEKRSTQKVVEAFFEVEQTL